VHAKRQGCEKGVYVAVEHLPSWQR
jgi:hypothetical protein